MLFPNTERIKYEKDQLDQVICQLRFPPVLKIDAELVPYPFHEKIRHLFPGYKPIEERTSDIAIGPGQVPSVMATNVNKNHEFYEIGDTVKVDKINLTRTFITYSANNYTRWEKFVETFEEIESAFREEYKPGFYVRLGLRYINTIKRSELGLEGIPWGELLNPRISGLLNDVNTLHNIKSLAAVWLITLPEEEASLRFATNLFKEPKTEEEVFRIDTDFSTEKRCAPEEYIDKLKYLHEEAYRCIQWCVARRLHDAMEPEPIKNE